MIIWDEYRHGKSVFEQGCTTTNRHMLKELLCLIKYMFYVGYKPRHVKQKLEEICNDFKYLPEELRIKLTERLIRNARKYDIIKDRKIIIYKSEIEKIEALKYLNCEKILFIMLVYNKWLGSYKWFEIKRMDIKSEAKIANVSSTKFNDTIRYLFQKGLFQAEVRQVRRTRYNYYCNTKYMHSLAILATEGEVAFEISNYINVVNLYLNYVYGGYFQCERCGCMYKKNSNRQKNCSDCREIINREQTRKRVAKHRCNALEQTENAHE